MVIQWNFLLLIVVAEAETIGLKDLAIPSHNDERPSYSHNSMSVDQLIKKNPAEFFVYISVVMVKRSESHKFVS